MNDHLLTIEERSCIRKYYAERLSCREIARLIGRNVSTVPRKIRTKPFSGSSCYTKTELHVD